jgi:hypothetical protein
MSAAAKRPAPNVTNPPAARPDAALEVLVVGAEAVPVPEPLLLGGVSGKLTPLGDVAVDPEADAEDVEELGMGMVLLKDRDGNGNDEETTESGKERELVCYIVSFEFIPPYRRLTGPGVAVMEQWSGTTLSARKRTGQASKQ